MSPNISVELGCNKTYEYVFITYYCGGGVFLVLYGHDTRSFTLWEEYGLRLFKNWLLRKISGFENEEVIGSWKSCIRKTLMLGG